MAFREIATTTYHMDKIEQYGGYFSLHYVFDVVASLGEGTDSDIGYLNLHCQILNFSQVNSPGTITGFGFMNVGGFMWGQRDNVRNEIRETNHSETSYPNPEGWDYDAGGGYTVHGQMQSAIDNFDADTLFCVYRTDDVAGTSYNGGWGLIVNGGNNFRDFKIPLSQSISVNVINPYSRYLVQASEETAGQEYTEIVQTGNVVLTFSDLFPDYFPGARFSSNASDPTWYSANRSGGHLQRFVNNAWRDCKNRIYPTTDPDRVANTVLRNVNNDWKRVDKMGQGA